jgi:hypothetical protein
MKKYSKEEVLRQYEESAKKMYQASLDGNYKANSGEGKYLLRIFKYFENNKEFAWDCIKDMLNSENVVVRTDAAAYCLALNGNIDIAEKVLSEISNNEDNGIFGFNAKKTLYVWKKQGYLRIYPSKDE